MRFAILTLLLTQVGCEQWKAPKRVNALEKRVAKLTEKLSELTGEDLDAEDDHATKGKDKDKGKGKGKGKGKDKAKDKKAKAKDKDKDAHDAAPEEDAEGDGDHEADEHEPPLAMPAKRKHKAGAHAAEGSGDDAGHAEGAAPTHGEPEDTPPAPSGKPAEWSYDGDTGPAKWGSLDRAWKTCAKGKAQSPIDLMPAKSTTEPITFDYKPVKARVIDTGRGLQVRFGEGSSIQIADKRYPLVALHVHTPSEHHVAGEQYPMELQLVHEGPDGKPVMIAVLYDTGPEAKALSPLVAPWPKKPSVEQPLKKPFDPSQLLPATRTAMRYEGSLTSPPCTEGVVWNVMRRTMTGSAKQLEAFRTHATNARPVQPLHERPVL